MNPTLGKIITVSSVKGGVGKTTLTANLAGLYFLLKKKVLIIDLDLYAGGIATILNVDYKKDSNSITILNENSIEKEISNKSAEIEDIIIFEHDKTVHINNK